MEEGFSGEVIPTVAVSQAEKQSPVLQERGISIWLRALPRLRSIVPAGVYDLVEESSPNTGRTMRESHRRGTDKALGVYRGGRQGILARGAANLG